MLLLEAREATGITFSRNGISSLIVRLIRTRYALIKRLFDIALSFIALIISTPLILTLSVLVKLTSPGPVFYMQTRIGKEGKPFRIIKFRTMHVNAEDGIGPVWAKPEDPRVTKLGYYIRALHLDEIPQFINIIKGDMSFIGPRPERPFFVDSFKMQMQGYTNRLMVKPGLTGLAQVRLKYDETIDDVKKKLSYDRIYIKKMCLYLDFKISVWTMGKIASKLLKLFRTNRSGTGSDNFILTEGGISYGK
ncbi:MAG TPA: sugar transferase [Candidatus Brocadiia bacterium]|nr:sugar transferase [Planctomycetota bacterium]MDO8092412.1 sugar transferase [Candidatus Brocadiales bacterium]